MKVYRLDGYVRCLRGLMFKNKIVPIILKTRFGIHTFFVRKPIDIAILDRNFMIRKLKKDLRPFRLFFWNPKYNIVIEGPSGFIENFNLKEGKKVDLEIVQD